MDGNQTEKLRPSFLRGTKTPFAWQDVRIMKRIRNSYSKKRRTTAIAIYQTLTELASIEGRGQGRHTSQFPVYLETIAERTGKSCSTIKRYTREFKQLGILSWENRKKGKMNLANLWKLLIYSNQNTCTTSTNNNELNLLDQHNNPPTEEYLRKYINNKESFKKIRANNGFQSLKDILEGK